jgi:hypothetical protein
MELVGRMQSDAERIPCKLIAAKITKVVKDDRSQSRTQRVAAAVVMPWLAKAKRRLSAATGSAALRADATQSALCAYLSLIGLAGLAINAIWHIKWADPIAALAVLPLIIWEGREAMRGKTCGCC